MSAPENEAVEAARTASADNFRLCRIVEAADALVKAIENYQRGTSWDSREVKRALDAFKVVRQGQ